MVTRNPNGMVAIAPRAMRQSVTNKTIIIVKGVTMFAVISGTM